MKQRGKLFIAGLLLVFVIAIGFTMTIGPSHVGACGWGASGGQDYVPKRNFGPNGNFQQATITKEQAQNIVTTHVKRLNSKLTIGKINDNGSIAGLKIKSKFDFLTEICYYNMIKK